MSKHSTIPPEEDMDADWKDNLRAIAVSPQSFTDSGRRRWVEVAIRHFERKEQANGRAEDAINKTFDLFEAIQKAGGRIDITDQMVERGASTSTTGRQSDPEYRDKIRLILDVALNG